MLELVLVGGGRGGIKGLLCRCQDLMVAHLSRKKINRKSKALGNDVSASLAASRSHLT